VSGGDEALLKLAAKGNEQAFEEIVRRHQGPIYRFLLRALGSAADAEEAGVEVFVRAWQHAGRFQFRASVSTWLFRIALNIARDMRGRRRSVQFEPLPEDEALIGEFAESAEDTAMRAASEEYRHQALALGLESLSASDRGILILYYLEEKEYEEIQAITGLSYTVLKTRLARARRRLREALESAGREVR
jgi:RNA polymerase sigma-70 factor (ECF subfamily)